ncbi:TniB family NTP-binding protein [Lysobacter changpingensis]|uniref:TniB family NTP-binding protein n=1 Tax=Lysobacter changpingensis TaxID=2792784 RepID=UPI001A8F620C|nr:TniB family NTP-binding protein [Lysobacter changpingensis]
MSTYAHLGDHTAKLVNEAFEVKTRAMRTLPFIPYAEGVALLRWLSFLRRVDAGCDRPRSIHLLGAPGAGKSRLLSHYAGLNPPEERNPAGTRPIPVAFVECPSDTNPKSLRSGIIEQCLPGFGDLSANEAVDLLESYGVRQLLIDEGGNLLNGGASCQQECLFVVSEENHECRNHGGDCDHQSVGERTGEG